MIEQVLAKAEEVQSKLEKFGYAKIPLKFEITKLKTGAAGQAVISTKLVKISKDYLREFPDHIFNITIAHEICHHYVIHYKPYAKQNHGPEFRRFMQLLGLRGDTYHKVGLPANQTRNKRKKIRFIYETAITKKVVKLTKTQHENSSLYTCRGERLVYKNQVVEII